MKLLIVALTFFAGITSYSQTNHKIDLPEYVREIQAWEKQEEKMSMAFWIPNGYWKIALEDSPQVPQESVALIEDAFKDYVMVCAIDLEISLKDGSMTFTEEQKMRKSISIQDSLGNVYLPLESDEISSEAQLFSQAIQPMFAQMLGKMGEGIHLYFFEIKDKNGKNIINEFEAGRFTVKHSKRAFEFKLPLSSLLPPKKCPVDNAEMKGNWNYCPIHGEKLEK